MGKRESRSLNIIRDSAVGFLEADVNRDMRLDFEEFLSLIARRSAIRVRVGLQAQQPGTPSGEERPIVVLSAAAEPA